MNFLSEIGKVLLIHDSMHRYQRVSVGLQRIDTLADRYNADAMELQSLPSAESVRKITGEPGRVIHEQAIEGTVLSLRGFNQLFQSVSARQRRAQPSPR